MFTQMTPPTRPGWRFWLLWMIATIAGAAAGLVLVFPLNAILVAALGEGKLGPWTTTETALIVVFKGAEGGVMGIGMGLGQWLVLRDYLKQTLGWILATGLVFFVQGAFMWNYYTLAVQVGTNTMLSFGIFLGLCQWFVLRGRVSYARWWIAISIAGWVLALALVAATAFAGLIESLPGIVFFAVVWLVPFAVAGGGMVWLLRQTAPAHQAIAS